MRLAATRRVESGPVEPDAPTLTIDIDDVRFKATLVDSLNVFELRGGLNDTQMAENLAREKTYTMGIFLIRQVMDEISYVYRKGFQNELELIKFL